MSYFKTLRDQMMKQPAEDMEFFSGLLDRGFIIKQTSILPVLSYRTKLIQVYNHSLRKEYAQKVSIHHLARQPSLGFDTVKEADKVLTKMLELEAEDPVKLLAYFDALIGQTF